MSAPVNKILFCVNCNGLRRHVPSNVYDHLHKCVICRTLTNHEHSIHTHTQGVTPSFKVDGFKGDDRVLRQKSEEKREGKKEKTYNPYTDHPTWLECKGCSEGNDWQSCEDCWTRKTEECIKEVRK